MPYSGSGVSSLFHIGRILIPSYGALAALGVLLALALAQRTARMIGVPAAQVWNLCVVSLFAALLGSRLLLVFVNWKTFSITLSGSSASPWCIIRC